MAAHPVREKKDVEGLQEDGKCLGNGHLLSISSPPQLALPWPATTAPAAKAETILTSRVAQHSLPSEAPGQAQPGDIT